MLRIDVGHGPLTLNQRAYNRDVGAYVCTYCHKNRRAGELQTTRTAAEKDPLLRIFLDGYNDSYYDWGDDPSFFAAQHLLGDVRKASWGVCRPDVRNTLEECDVVVFFCACQRQDEHVWRYYFVGFGTVLELVDRAVSTKRGAGNLWTDRAYEAYRKFYNVLVSPDGGRLVQNEMFHPYHDDWKRRADAPYVLFDGASSSFNLRSPHCVATWDGETVPEKWLRDDDRSKEIERLLFVDRGINRRLRTSASGHPHPKLNLLKARRTTRPGLSLSELTRALRPLV